MKKIIYVVNNLDFIISHRYEICLEAMKIGNEVHVAAPYNEDSVSKITKAGMHYHNIGFHRKGMNPLREFLAFLSLFRLFFAQKPDLIHLITIKPYLYGGIAAKLLSVKSVVSAVAGLGILFSSQKIKYRIVRVLLYPFFKIAFSNNNQKVIFQNKDDRDLLLNAGVLLSSKSVIVRGSGVDLSLYPYIPEPSGTPVITFASRLLLDKGVEEFVNASRILRAKNVDVEFWLIGQPDPGNANSVSDKQLKNWESEGLVKLLGFRRDIASLFSKSNIITLPSYYGEGLPKVLVEAASCGRAVITTDHPGCRDAIVENETGLLIKIKDAESLAESILFLLQNPEKRKEMGGMGRQLAEKHYSIDMIVAAHMGIYNELLNKVSD